VTWQGRDANKRLQRAIRATKLRERLPVLLSDLRSRLLEWRECEDQPFMYDGKDYQVGNAACLHACMLHCLTD
jgi:hypothetical protein